MPLNLPFIAGQSGKDKEENQRYELLRSIGQQATKSQDFASTYPVTLTRGLPGTPLTHGLSSPLKWPINDFGGQVFNVRAYGAKGDGVTDDTAAINAAITAAGLAGGGTVFLPPGIYRVVQSGSTVPFLINYGNVWITGAARRGTTISFAPSSGGPVFQFNSGGAPINYNGIERLLFTSSDTTTQKTAVRAYDLNSFIVREIAMSDNEWIGASSIGVHFRGRQEIRLRDCEIYSDLPVVIDENPNLAGANEISFDHSSITDSDLVVTAGLNNQSITIKDKCVLSNCSFERLAFVRGNGGIIMNNTTSSARSYSIVIRNVRSEQSNTTTGYTIDMRSVDQIQSLEISNVDSDPVINCVRLDNAKWPLLMGVSYGGTGTFLDLTSAVSGFTILNSFRQSGSTITDSSVSPNAINLTVGGNPPFSNFGSLVGNGSSVSAVYYGQTEVQLTLANGDNNNVATTAGWNFIAGPTAAFAVTGVVAGSPGEEAVFANNVAQTLTLKHNNGSSSAANRLFLKEGADTAIGAGFAWFRIKYFAALGAWVVVGHS